MTRAYVLPIGVRSLASDLAPSIEPGFTKIAPPPAGGRSERVSRSFEGHIDVRYLDGRRWQLLAEFVYCSTLLQTCIRCPAGFITDFASIPSALWRVLTPTDPRIGPAAVIHDTLYRDTSFRVTKDEADHVLVEAMELLGASTTLRTMVYYALHAFGRGFQPR